VIFASGSFGLYQSSFEPFFFRFRSRRARSSRVGVSIPEAFARSSRNVWYVRASSRRTIERIAAFASSVVASTPIVLPLMSPAPSSTPSTHVNTA
jgi:hypothetical protein